MRYYLSLLINDDLSQRSYNQHGEGCIFSLDVSESYVAALMVANQGSVYAYSDKIREGTRTPARGNNSNWRFSLVLEFDSYDEAQFAKSVIVKNSKSPQILPSLLVEVCCVEVMRSGYTADFQNETGWNDIESIRCIGSESSFDLDLIVPALFKEEGINYRRNCDMFVW